MPPMFVPAGVVAMTRAYGPKPAEVLKPLVTKFRTENGIAPDSLHLTYTSGVEPLDDDESAEWNAAFQSVLTGGN